MDKATIKQTEELLRDRLAAARTMLEILNEKYDRGIRLHNGLEIEDCIVLEQKRIRQAEEGLTQCCIHYNNLSR
jgi:hypothetical protein